MEIVFLGLGSNVGDRKKNILKAIFFLEDKIHVMKIGKIYISKAVGYENQPDFFNTVICGKTDLSPEDLFNFIKNVEKKVGRIERFRWGPREIDIDILFYGERILKSNNLTIPHPRIHERDFVLKPLMDIDQNFRHPVFNKSIKELYSEVKDFSIIGTVDL
ncbi:2-amino-4-hydroxy-6-hydroxymethyldihydropteridine diphosphokinase [Persephonella sp.]